MPRSVASLSDHVASDDMGMILERINREEASNRRAGGPGPSAPQRSAANGQYFEREGAQTRARIANLDAEIHSYQEDIKALQNRLELCFQERKKLEAALNQARQKTATAAGSSRKAGTDYATEVFDWSNALKKRMKEVFNIDDFRLAQRGACNANMDGRDIVCIMPTGGGKSLTYQLPALLTAGCTLVISPLISLMTDQVLHLEEAGIEAKMITGATSKSEKNRTIESLKMLADRRLGPLDKELKLLYVTPEKLNKDKSFRSLLQRLDQAGKLVRVVIDEAHCVSQLGHDFRPDYKELHILRKMLPKVPIMALSATCGPQVLKDLIHILGLREPVDGTNAPALGTVYFSSPLYRKNLHYSVVPKPDKAEQQIAAMKDYILEKHPNDSGIIYCFSVKDTEVVAEKLRTSSNGRIKTGVYNSRIQDAEKHKLHVDWRQGRIKIVCATIAFGLGIDKGDVRFVLHHSISKSLEGFYQESGRAGRDGRDSDCVLYYRPQDAASLGGLTSSEKDGARKLHAVLDFAEDLRRCRKVQFAEYFSHSSQLSVSAWTTEESGALDPCGHCDNCTRPADTFELRDATFAAWQILRIVEAVRQSGAKLTLSQLVALARGGKKGAFEVKRGRKKEQGTLDIDTVAGGPVEMSKVDLEHLLVYLLTQEYLQEEYQQTAYTCNVYLAPGPLAARLKYLPRESISSAKVKIEFNFLRRPAKGAKKKKRVDDEVEDEDADEDKDADRPKRKPTPRAPRKRTADGASKKGKERAVTVVDSDDGDLSSIEDADADEEGVFVTDYDKAPEPAAVYQADSDGLVVSDSAREDYEWETYALKSKSGRAPKRRRVKAKSEGFKIIKEGGTEVMVLSSD